MLALSCYHVHRHACLREGASSECDREKLKLSENGRGCLGCGGVGCGGGYSHSANTAHEVYIYRYIYINECGVWQEAKATAHTPAARARHRQP